MTPYISITDFMTETQTLQMLRVFREAGGPATGRRLGVGVMMSRKTLNNIPSKWDTAFPLSRDIRFIFMPYPSLLNVLHYADYEGIDVEANLRKAVGYGGPYLEAVQLDMVWPDPTAVQKALEGTQVILQISTNALDLVNNDPLALVAKLRAYGQDTLSAVLLDRSMGRGLGMDAEGLLPYALAIGEHLPDIHIAVAGGLGPDTLHLVEPLIRVLPDISIDAQSRLRQSGSALDPIDWDLAGKYLQKAIALFT